MVGTRKQHIWHSSRRLGPSAHVRRRDCRPGGAAFNSAGPRFTAAGGSPCPRVSKQRPGLALSVLRSL
jgi:hypothetical protein